MKVSFSNYRFFDESMEFDFAPITILTGTNSSGKSSLTYGLRLFKDGFKNGKITLSKQDLMQIGSVKNLLNRNKENLGNEIFFNYTFDCNFSIFPKLSLKIKFSIINDTNIVGDYFRIINSNSNSIFWKEYFPYVDHSENLNELSNDYNHRGEKAVVQGHDFSIFSNDEEVLSLESVWNFSGLKSYYSELFHFILSYEELVKNLQNVLGDGNSTESNIIERQLNKIYKTIIDHFPNKFEGGMKDAVEKIKKNGNKELNPNNLLELIVHIYNHGGLGIEPFESFIKDYVKEIYACVGYKGSYNDSIIHEIIQLYYDLTNRILRVGVDEVLNLGHIINYEHIRRYINNTESIFYQNCVVDIKSIRLFDVETHYTSGILDLIRVSNIRYNWNDIFPDYDLNQINTIKLELEKEFGKFKYEIFYFFKTLEKFDNLSDTDLCKISKEELSKRLVLNLYVYGKIVIENSKIKRKNLDKYFFLQSEFSNFIQNNNEINDLIKKIENNLFLFLNCFKKAREKLDTFNKNININHHPNLNVHLDKRYVELLDSKNFLSEILEKYYNNKNIKSDAFIKKWIKELNVGDDFHIDKDEQIVKLFIYRDGQEFLLNDEGKGIGKLFPIILHIATLGLEKRKGYLIIEEPESNLHPKLQSKLADLFLDAYKEFSLKFIIETHSEYMIRKLQYIVAKNKGAHYLNEDINIYYFYHPREIPEGEKQVFEIKITKEGRLTKNFGKGFLDEASDLSMLLFQTSIN